MDSWGGGLEPGRPGAPNALRVSSTIFQDWGNTRNQPVRLLPYFDREPASLISLRRQDAPLGVACLSATDGALIERRREEIEGPVPARGAVVRFEVPEVSPA